MSRLVHRRMVVRLRADQPRSVRPDTLIAEEPLEIRVGGEALSVTMRTPGADMDLVAGFLLGEGVIHAREDLVAMRYCAGASGEGNTYNVLDATLASHVPAVGDALRRSTYMTSSCGVCGKASIDAVRTSSRFDVADDVMRVAASVVRELPDRLRGAQELFDKTGGLHAAGLFTTAGELLVSREDVGRHNAVDKVVGWALREGRVPLRETVLLVSGRASFELTQKAWMAGIPVLAAVSAPSALAVELADSAGLTLIGFVRGSSMVVYSSAHRVIDDLR